MSRTVRTKVYKFSELSEKAKDRVIEDRINDMVQYEWAEFKKAIDMSERMQTPWFTGSYVWEYCGKGIVAALTEDQECKYTKDGKYFN
jgi:hypothetical protein